MHEYGTSQREEKCNGLKESAASYLAWLVFETGPVGSRGSALRDNPAGYCTESELIITISAISIILLSLDIMELKSNMAEFTCSQSASFQSEPSLAECSVKVCPAPSFLSSLDSRAS